MLRKILEQKEKQANNVFDVDLLGDTSADEKKIIKILNEQPIDKIAVKLTRLKDSCRNVHNGTFLKRYNYIMSRVLLHDQYIGSAKVFSENKEKLELLIKSAERDQGIFQDSAVDFYNALLFCYDEQNSLDEKYAKILEFSFAIEDRLANAERYFDKKTEHQKILDLRDKLIVFFVRDEATAKVIISLKNSFDEFSVLPEVVIQKSGNAFLTAYFKLLNGFLVKLFKNGALASESLASLVRPFSFEEKTSLVKLLFDDKYDRDLIYAELLYIYNTFGELKGDGKFTGGVDDYFFSVDENEFTTENEKNQTIFDDIVKKKIFINMERIKLLIDTISP